jgi:hypothetical protein
MLDFVCVFRGEERGPRYELEEPRSKLTNKLKWSYGDVSYLFGYAVIVFLI